MVFGKRYAPHAAKHRRIAFAKRLYKTLPFGAFFVFGPVVKNRTLPKVRIRENSWLAKQAAKNLGFDYMAMVVGRTIHLHNTTLEKFFARPSWVIHELKHVEQYERHGMLIFVFRYGMEHFRKGYWNNAFETEARASESDISLLLRYDLSEYAEYMNLGY